MSKYENLLVWKKAHELVLEIYRVTTQFPDAEKYGIVVQMRRSAASIPTNISEGHGRLYRREYIRFLAIARGSACELEYQLILARDLGYLDKEKTDELLGKLREILRMLNGLINTLKKSQGTCDL
ncbi:MAG: hypothetical protein HPY66_1856 [Firmicutes bacterium]|nr:hypothetical protein [Bacillota bacterium]